MPAFARYTLIAAPLLLGAAYGVMAAGSAPAGCVGDNGGLSLPAGFCASIFADNVGHTRHLVVAGDGTVYVLSLIHI